MLNTKMLAIIAGIAVVAATVTAYALIGVNGNGNVTVNENKGKGTVDTLEFKNPVTIKLLDPNGNVVGEKTVYNALTNAGRTYIYDALRTGSTNAIDIMAFVNSNTGAIVPNGQLTDSNNNLVDLTPLILTCSIVPGTPDKLDCVATFTTNYTAPAAGSTLNLNTGVELILGRSTTPNPTPYFNITSLSSGIPVAANQAISSIQITWSITAT